MNHSAEAPTTHEFSAYKIIQKKRDGKKLRRAEIQWFIAGLLKRTVDEVQMAALLMAIYLQGLDKEETAWLTDAMLYSGQVLDFADPTVIDKHSTGGVGDKTSFILAPIAAACGVKVPMIAGRGLGHTGGTIDKIESIAGLQTSLDLTTFSEHLTKYGLVLIGQTEQIAPADKIIYALRDITATIESIPLITASIMSKKLAEGANGIVMDIKVGQGAFMKNLTEGRKLAKSVQETAARFNKKMLIHLTNMSEPLGYAVGNGLEIIECIETLKGRGPKDLRDLSVSLAGGMIYLAGLAKSHGAGIKQAKAAIKDGRALQKFSELIARQGGDIDYLTDYKKFKLAAQTTPVLAPHSGYIHAMDTVKIGLACVELGGGRQSIDDQIDFSVGLVFHKKIGAKIKAGETLVTIYHHPQQIALVEKICQDFSSHVILIKKVKAKTLKPLIFATKG